MRVNNLKIDSKVVTLKLGLHVHVYQLKKKKRNFLRNLR